MIRSESIANIAPAFLKAQKAMEAVVKDAKNPFFKSDYATLNAVMDTCKKPLNDNGIMILQPVNGDHVETVLMHESGEFFASQTALIVKEQNNPQSYGSSVSYARRYGLMSMLGLPADDDDAESAMNRNATATPRPAPQPVENNAPSLKQKDAIALILRHNVGLDASGIKTKADASKFISEHGQGRTYASYVS